MIDNEFFPPKPLCNTFWECEHSEMLFKICQLPEGNIRCDKFEEHKSKLKLKEAIQENSELLD